MKKIGIIGSRTRDSGLAFDLVKNKFLSIYKEGDQIVSGGCPKGGDRFAEVLAKQIGIPILIFYPCWKKYGKAAGFIRNVSIANESDCLIACAATDRTGGTEDTITKFEKLNKGDVYVV